MASTIKRKHVTEKDRAVAKRRLAKEEKEELLDDEEYDVLTQQEQSRLEREEKTARQRLQSDRLTTDDEAAAAERHNAVERRARRKQFAKRCEMLTHRGMQCRNREWWAARLDKDGEFERRACCYIHTQKERREQLKQARAEAGVRQRDKQRLDPAYRHTTWKEEQKEEEEDLTEEARLRAALATSSI